MKTMQYKGYSARIDYDEDEKIFFGSIYGLQDNIGFHADTVPDLKTSFSDSIDDYLETCRKIGKSPEKPYATI